MGGKEKAKQYFDEGRQKPVKYCFPFRLKSIQVYKTALSYLNEDARACYYLGNLLFDKQPRLAIEYWEKAVRIEPELAMAHRNLGWGYQKFLKDNDKAIEAYQAAIRHDPEHPRFYAELDKLLEARGDDIEIRLTLLQENHEVVARFQGSLMREIVVLVHAGKYDRAIELMDSRMFYRQEDVNILHDIHADAHLLKGKRYLASGNPEAALKEFLVADTYPDNQMIERIVNYDRNPRILYYTGLVYEAGGDKKSAMEFFTNAASQEGIDNEYLYYKAMALGKSGKKKEAERIFEQMIELAKVQLVESEEVDFFAKFGGNLTENQRKGRSYHIMGLANMGLDDAKKAEGFFKKSLEYDVNQIWSRVYLNEL